VLSELARRNPALTYLRETRCITLGNMARSILQTSTAALRPIFQASHWHLSWRRSHLSRARFRRSKRSKSGWTAEVVST